MTETEQKTIDEVTNNLDEMLTKAANTDPYEIYQVIYADVSDAINTLEGMK